MNRLLKWLAFAVLLHAASYAVPTPLPRVEIPADIIARADAVKPQPIYRFTSDGCSGFLSLGWRLAFQEPPPFENCCVAHDLAYWQGGSASDRETADAHLLQCVDQAGYPLLSWIIWAGVRVGGGPKLPTPYRWGYGLPFYTPYARD